MSENPTEGTVNEPTDAQIRTKEFSERYGKLVEELEIDYASYPSFVPDGQGGFKIVIQSVPVDVKGRGTPSPFIEKE